jgi:NAD(P)-dependent dehydrogenase (short-subunit alcohol dehydrogenase family)
MAHQLWAGRERLGRTTAEVACGRDAVLLDGQNAVIYGGGGAIGGAVARAFAREGARVFLAGRTPARLEEVAADIRAAGGRADTAEVDALDERAVDAHADAVASQAGSIDVCLNVISHGDVQGTPFVEMAVEGYLRPVDTAVRTTFLTSRAAGRHMVRQGSGVLLAFGGRATRRATTTWAASRSPSRPSRPCGASSPPSWGAAGSGS